MQNQHYLHQPTFAQAQDALTQGITPFIKILNNDGLGMLEMPLSCTWYPVEKIEGPYPVLYEDNIPTDYDAMWEVTFINARGVRQMNTIASEIGFKDLGQDLRYLKAVSSIADIQEALEQGRVGMLYFCDKWAVQGNDWKPYFVQVTKAEEVPCTKTRQHAVSPDRAWNLHLYHFNGKYEYCMHIENEALARISLMDFYVTIS